MSEEIKKFSLRRKQTKIVMENADGLEQEYSIRELSGRERELYLDKVSAKIKYDENGKAIGMTSYDGMHSSLLSKCLFDEKGKNVPEETIMEYPSSVVGEIFKIAQEINALGEEAQDEAKNA